jgi:hypothetical protein
MIREIISVKAASLTRRQRGACAPHIEIGPTAEPGHCLPIGMLQQLAAANSVTTTLEWMTCHHCVMLPILQEEVRGGQLQAVAWDGRFKQTEPT